VGLVGLAAISLLEGLSGDRRPALGGRARRPADGAGSDRDGNDTGRPIDVVAASCGPTFFEIL
jgi:hypothetical protein